MTAAQALARLLDGSPYVAVPAGSGSYRIARRPAQSTQTAPAANIPAPPPPPPVEPIVVSASKRDVPFSDYPGGVTIFDFEGALPSREMGGVEDLLATAPVTGSTALGPGRNKIFIRGISDSSFNGPTQSTVGLYFGEQRLIYSAPNPELRMYDVDGVELLEGPQGTLYGAGALGGIVRIRPHHPELGEWGAQAWAAGSLTRHGDPGYDVAGLANAPLGDHAALRLLAYAGRLGGYIDDAGRNRDDVNSTSIRGARAVFRVDPGNGWTIDLSGLFQELDTRDGQYAERGLTPLTRSSTIAQPFDSDVAVGGITIRKTWGWGSLVSATSFVRSSLDTRFDASVLSPNGDPLAFDEDRRVTLLNHETRLSGRGGSRSWVIGVEAIRNIDRRDQFLGDPANPAPFAATRDATTEVALFGETSVPITGRLSATAGARTVYATSFSEFSTATGQEIEPRTDFFRLLPMAALSWRFDERTIGYLRYQEGYRAGGVSIAGLPGMPSAARFDRDELRTVEAGIRRAGEGLPLELSASVFFTDWNEIQADLITNQGFPETRNVGSGSILGLTASAAYRPIEGLVLHGAVFANETELTPDPALGPGEDGPIPNVAEFGAQADIGYTHALSDTANLDARAEISYVGQSRLGTGPFLDIEQGRYATLAASIAYRSERFTIALEGQNLTDVHGNRFGFGNPFSLSQRGQTTPLRPRLIRLSTTVRF